MVQFRMRVYPGRYLGIGKQNKGKYKNNELKNNENDERLITSF